MARRGKRKKITYDSNESRYLFGLISFLTAGTIVMSFYTSGKAIDFFKQLFGNGSILFAISFVYLGLKLFRFKPNFITSRAVVGWFLVSIAWSTFVAGQIDQPLNFKTESYTGLHGGILGYEIAQFIGDYLFMNFVKPLSLIVIFISIPFIVSLTIPQYFNFIKNVLLWFKNKIDGISNRIGSDETEGVADVITEGETDEDIQKAMMVGDFRKENEKLLAKEEKLKKEKAQSTQEKKTEFYDNSGNPQLLRPESVNYTVKKDENDKTIVMQEELKYPNWKLPPITLLNTIVKTKPSTIHIKKNSHIIEKTLSSFGVKAQVVDVLIGPSVTQFALNIALGTKVSKIANLKNDLALALAAESNSVRIESPIPGTSFVGIEIPNVEREMIGFKEMAIKLPEQSGMLPVAIGKNVSGDKIYADIQKMPHQLIAGATGSGKSVVTNSFIMSLLMQKSPDEVRFIMVDPKQVELSDYNGIPHLLTPVITDMEKVNNALKWAINEMESRYTVFRESRVRNIEEFNKKMGFAALPYIVIVIDEMADMMMTQHGPEIENSIVRLAQKARATGIHLILATQRPSVDVITGLIKANIPGRIGMSVTTQIDSRVILDQIGAESLLGRGDMLYKDPSKSRMDRIQGNFVSQEEVTRVVNYIKNQAPEVEYTEQVTGQQLSANAPEGSEASFKFSDDELFAQAARIVVNARKGSSSLIQRKLSIGYNRAARLLDELEEQGIVGSANGSKPRDILVSDIESFLSAGPRNSTASTSEFGESD